jgi:hypothetical protein
LVLAETTDNLRVGELLLRRPEFITRLGETFKDEAWKETRVRLAQLLPDERHFDIMNAYYSNTASLIWSAAQTAEVGEDADDALRGVEAAFRDEALREEVEKTNGWGQDVQSIILSYIPPNRVTQYRTHEQIEQEVQSMIRRQARQYAEKEIERMERAEIERIEQEEAAQPRSWWQRVFGRG